MIEIKVAIYVYIHDKHYLLDHTGYIYIVNNGEQDKLHLINNGVDVYYLNWEDTLTEKGKISQKKLLNKLGVEDFFSFLGE